MNLYDIVPENLFSILVSPNKSLYVKALFVLLDAFKIHLQISKDELVSMLISSLEADIISADFSGENLLENEHSLSGKAHFIVRKLKTDEWIYVETEADFVDYVTLPNYSIKIIQLLYDLTHLDEQENFAYVYSTYSSLKMADVNREPFELYAALYDSANRTQQLVESLKSAYHGITTYNQQLIDAININNVLSLHYDMFRQEIAERILKPLKIRDSVPKYKHPIEMILKSWLVNDEILDSLADYSYSAKKFDSREKCYEDIKSKIYYIIDTYEGLERDYISVIDAKNRQYTRATTQKIDYLINSDQTIKGNLITLLKYISDDDTSESAVKLLSDSFELYDLCYVSEESLFERKRGVRRDDHSTVEIDDNDPELEVKARAAAIRIMNNKYSKKNIMKFIHRMLDGKTEIGMSDISVTDDETYIMTMLSVAYAGDRDSDYTIEVRDGSIYYEKYGMPDIVFRKKVKK
ncbi:Wadjet anti-phage system protein JetA family protein [Ruminococcus bicirculans (ex Wegman et al. 2014)]|uniref:Wadjet anti-phage system protein JetA family protein n=1 Tax=Ruminococcus bicirculans (ex Wegman et al. 2014) TaxID=1160721 RepID=UPI00366FC36C